MGPTKSEITFMRLLNMRCVSEVMKGEGPSVVGHRRGEELGANSSVVYVVGSLGHGETRECPWRDKGVLAVTSLASDTNTRK